MQYYAHGKLFLAGEYVVLRGADALAIPTKYGQQLEVLSANDSTYKWEAYDVHNQLWLEVNFDENWEVISTNDAQKANTLQSVFRTVQILKGSKLPFFRAKTTLEFERSWGLGTSSSLIALIAKWQKIDALSLFENALTGSGYDVASALSDVPVMYNMLPQKHYKTVELPNALQDSFFVYLGQKQNSEKEVIAFKDREVAAHDIAKINHIAQALTVVENLTEVEKLISDHEEIIGNILERLPIKERLFKDYPGAVKSLGAWGGDFIWATQVEEKNYFKTKGYQTIIEWKDMIY